MERTRQMRKRFWRVNLLAAVIAAGLFAVMAGLLHWNLGGTALFSLGIFLALTVLLTPRTPQEMQGDAFSSPLGDLEGQADALQQTALQCRDAEVREAGRSLFDTAKSVLDYLSVAPEKIEAAKWSLQGGLSSVQTLLSQYLEQEEGQGGGLFELRQKALSAIRETDAAFEQQLEALLQGLNVPKSQGRDLTDPFNTALGQR